MEVKLVKDKAAKSAAVVLYKEYAAVKLAAV